MTSGAVTTILGPWGKVWRITELPRALTWVSCWYNAGSALLHSDVWLKNTNASLCKLFLIRGSVIYIPDVVRFPFQPKCANPHGQALHSIHRLLTTNPRWRWGNWVSASRWVTCQDREMVPGAHTCVALCVTMKRFKHKVQVNTVDTPPRFNKCQNLLKGLHMLNTTADYLSSSICAPLHFRNWTLMFLLGRRVLA